MEKMSKDPSIKWLDDPAVFGVNRINAHSDHAFYASQKELDEDKSTLCSSLAGDWRFIYSRNSKLRPADFYRWDYTDETVLARFDNIKVPGHIEIAGYDRIHYINTMYPWEGHIFRRPFDADKNAFITGSFADADYNPVGSYVRLFDAPKQEMGNSFRLRFEGVEQAYYVWLNGTFIGYSEDSFSAHEFDITDVIKEKDNVLAVEVHKRSTAAFLEDQDFFRFFGIFRDVKLITVPRVHIEDMFLRTVTDVPGKKGTIRPELSLLSPAENIKLEIKILGPDKEELYTKTEAIDIQDSQKNDGIYLFCPKDIEIKDIKPWEYASNVLYTVVVSVFDQAGKLCEIVPYRIGFRNIEIKNNVIMLNGKRLRICGVNRHEWNPSGGRCIDIEDMKRDMEIIRQNNINAVRTCHYPDRIEWYYMCDEAGIYMMAETNMETHGSWMKLGMIEPSWNVPGSDPVWGQAVLDRAKSNFEWFKNHTSILFWSLGNESFAGEAIVRMNEYFKSKNDGRIVHYEGVVMNREGYEDRISDVESRMYAKPDDVAAYLDNAPKKPFILCEYMHCMGNSLGGFGSYTELFDRYESYAGGFIWDFIDQAIYVTDEVTGKKVLRYGGDFDDRPNDGEFSQNGIVFADRSEKPAMQEVRYYYGKYCS